MTLRIRWLLTHSFVATALIFSACESSASETEVADSDTQTTSPQAPAPTPPEPFDCVLGRENCECLEGGCIGLLQCIENVCLPGPEVDVQDDAFRVIAGMRVPVRAEVIAESFAWSQTSGPNAALEGTDANEVLVDVPGDAVAGDIVTITLLATRNGIEANSNVSIEVIDAQFGNGLPGIDDPAQLGTATAVDFRGGELWAVSNEGFVSWFELDRDDDVETARYEGNLDIPAGVAAARLGRVPRDETEADVMLLANADEQALQTVQINGGATATLAEQTVDTVALGALNAVVRMDDALYATNGEAGQLLVWDPQPPQPDEPDETDAVPAGARVLLDGLVQPSALATGPEPGILYVGVAANVLRVPILPSGEAGEPSVYVDFGDENDPALTVRGIAFDAALNIFVGTDGRLMIARYAAQAATQVHNSLESAPAGLDTFDGLIFGEGQFGAQTLYYTNDRALVMDGMDTDSPANVGRVFVGLGPL